MYYLADQLPSFSTLLSSGNVPRHQDLFPNRGSDPSMRQQVPAVIKLAHGNSQRIGYWKTVMGPVIFTCGKWNLSQQASDLEMTDAAILRDSSPTNSPYNDIKQVPSPNEKTARTNRKMRKYQCQICLFRFQHRYDLKQHRNAVHLGLRPHICSECGSKHGHRGSLNKHIRAVHRKERKFRCEHCSHMFSERGNLNKHKLRVKACREKEILVNGGQQRMMGHWMTTGSWHCNWT